jgi:hypothetical protein
MVAKAREWSLNKSFIKRTTYRKHLNDYKDALDTIKTDEISAEDLNTLLDDATTQVDLKDKEIGEIGKNIKNSLDKNDTFGTKS